MNGTYRVMETVIPYILSISLSLPLQGRASGNGFSNERQNS